MSLQKQFEIFDNNIRLSDSKLNELRDKRDILLNKLKEDNSLPSFNEFSQGSYRMRTEVEPIDKEYDIDVGLRFNVNKDEYEDPLELKRKIRDILKNHTEYGAEIKNPCVTVKYSKEGETTYHVDIVTYVYENKNDKDSQLYLARGKEYSESDKKIWENADPLGLINEIESKYIDSEDKDQYKRIIRYLKRWKNIVFNTTGNSELPGIAITLLAYNLFDVSKEYDSVVCQYSYNDFDALIKFVLKIKNQFITIIDTKSSEVKYTIKLDLPVQPYTNVFSKMTLNQTNNLKMEIDKLYEKLCKIRDEADTIKKCEILNEIFGDDFEVPSVESQSKIQKNYIPSSSASGK